MINKKIHLKDFYPLLENDVILESFCIDNSEEINLDRKRKTVLVLPGGGYNATSDREAEPIAYRLLGYDINAFLLRYTCMPKVHFPYPLIEVYASIDYIRKHSEEFNVDKNDISVLGFSAGGHLAASAGAFYSDPRFYPNPLLKSDDVKPNRVLLGYPVITSNSYAHEGTINNISEGKEELRELFSLEKRVNSSYPKTFIYHTVNDEVVPVMNAILLSKALSENNVPFELHIYPEGIHGSSLCDQSVYSVESFNKDLEYNKDWFDHLIRFIKEK